MAAERSPEPGISTRDGMTEAECRQALDELERYSLFARHARDIILAIHADGRIIEANDAALHAYGYSHDELLSLTIYDLRAEWTIPDIRAQMERAEACGLLFETVHRRQDGSTFPVEVSASGASIGGERVLVSIIRDITERRDVVEAMREREREYRTLAENSPEVIARFDRRLRHTYINEYGAKVYGVSKEEVIGKANADLGMPPDKVAYWKEHLEEVLASGKQQTADFEFDSPTFGHQHFSSLFVPEFDEEGEVASVLAITRDITPIKKAEQALEAERSRLQTVLATLPVGVFIAEASGRIVEINDAGRRIWGQSAPMVEGVSQYVEYKGWHPETGEQYAAQDWALARALTKGKTIVGEVVDIERFDGTRGTILNSAAPIRDDQGRIVGAVVTVQDITDIRVAEEEVRRSRDLLQAIIDNTPAGIYVKDPGGTIIVANKALADLVGHPKEDLIGKTSFDFYPPDVAEAHTENDREIMCRGEPATFEEIVPEDGEVRTFLSSKFPLKDDEGHVYGIGGVSTDITERVRTEHALEADRQRIAALGSISEAGISTLEYQELLDLLVRRIREGMDTHSATILIYDESTDELVARAVQNIPEPAGFRVPVNEWFVGRIHRELRTVHIRDASTDPQVTNPHIRRPNVKSMLGTPLMARGRFLGVVYVDEQRIREFSPEETRLFELMAGRASLAIENARLFEEVRQSRRELEDALDRELYFSRQLQRALLPPAPEVGPGYSVGHIYIPAYAGREVGGDFYDVFGTESGCVGILIGDVSGKGLEAASVAAATRSTVRAFAYDLSSAGKALSHANAVMTAQQTGAVPVVFVTVFLVILNPETGEISYSSAGHPPAAVYHADSAGVEFLESGNPPIGIIPIHDFEECTALLAPRDRLVLYTDGLSEARHDHEMFETTGIAHVLRDHGTESPEGIVGALVSRATEWAEGHLRDDTAVVVVGRNADQG